MKDFLDTLAMGLFICSAIVFLLGCGRDDINCYTKGDQCHEEQGPQGEAGSDGERGDTGPLGPEGKRGEVGESGLPGTEGTVGPIGPQGTEGSSGSSCSVVETETGAVIFCEDGTSAEVLHGEDCKGKKK